MYHTFRGVFNDITNKGNIGLASVIKMDFAEQVQGNPTNINSKPAASIITPKVNKPISNFLFMRKILCRDG